MLAQKHPYRVLVGFLALLLFTGPLLACQPLQPITAPTSEPAAEAAAPVEQPLAPLEPIAYAEGACIDFGVYPDDTSLPLPFTLNNLRFDNLGEPNANFPFVNVTNDRLGLQFTPDGLRVDFGAPATLVTLEVANYTGEPVVVELFTDGDDPIVSQEVTQEEGVAALAFSEADMQALQLRGGGFEGMLLTLCVDQTIAVLSPVEIAIPYPPGITLPIGDAELVPGYEPMRAAVAALTEQLLAAGVQINTARTVLLKEGEIALPDRDGLWAETVAFAPIGPLGRDFANGEELTQLLAEQAVIGVLVMETDIPDHPLPSGAYLMRAQRQDTEGIVSLIDVNGEVAYEIPLFAARFAEELFQVPTAAIYEGTKYCVTRRRGWAECVPCSLWQILWGQGADQCPALLNQ
jgi:hypothetical protein